MDRKNDKGTDNKTSTADQAEPKSKKPSILSILTKGSEFAELDKEMRNRAKYAGWFRCRPSSPTPIRGMGLEELRKKHDLLVAARKLELDGAGEGSADDNSPGA